MLLCNSFLTSTKLQSPQGSWGGNRGAKSCWPTVPDLFPYSWTMKYDTVRDSSFLFNCLSPQHK